MNKKPADTGECYMYFRTWWHQILTCSFWPSYIKMQHQGRSPWQQQTLKSICFFMGNNCNPSTINLIVYWICSSLCRASSQDRSSRCEYLHWVLMNMHTNQHYWFYYEMQRGGYYFLDSKGEFWREMHMAHFKNFNVLI